MPCLYDVYIIGILHVVDTFGVPLLLFYTLFVERHNQRIMQVVRERTVNDVLEKMRDRFTHFVYVFLRYMSLL